MFKNILSRGLSMRSFSSSVYVWKGMPRFSAKASQTASKYALSSGIPTKVENIPNPVKVRMGSRASGVVTEEGDLYTFGNGNWGVLGHGSENNVSHTAAKKVEKFSR